MPNLGIFGTQHGPPLVFPRPIIPIHGNTGVKDQGTSKDSLHVDHNNSTLTIEDRVDISREALRLLLQEERSHNQENQSRQSLSDKGQNSS